MAPRLRFWNALGAAALVAALGVYASSQTGDWINFARSGAVIVIIGAVVTTWDWLRAGNSLVLLRRHCSPTNACPRERKRSG